ncbi:hypothetical protein SAY86_003786 [Trapa natans]|uniref:Uncharacterized protein n=1 Tax=Trapa natans TaxID=22666 RepID=A0AAN7MEU5_TRANT|nr:hypothetical protein SAY86_003786 [Trapa natans]
MVLSSFNFLSGRSYVSAEFHSQEFFPANYHWSIQFKKGPNLVENRLLITKKFITRCSMDREASATEYGPYDYTRSGNPTRTALEGDVMAGVLAVKGQRCFCIWCNFSKRIMFAGKGCRIRIELLNGINSTVQACCGDYKVLKPNWSVKQFGRLEV